MAQMDFASGNESDFRVGNPEKTQSFEEILCGKEIKKAD